MNQKALKTKAKYIPQPKVNRNSRQTDDNKENMCSKINQRNSINRKFGKDITLSIKNTSIEKNKVVNNSQGRKSLCKESPKVNSKLIFSIPFTLKRILLKEKFKEE
ncbi:MAG: hypothetical protein MJ252_16165 [archaeon]|nr:hypothetical protein [archaeon]